MKNVLNFKLTKKSGKLTKGSNSNIMKQIYGSCALNFSTLIYTTLVVLEICPRKKCGQKDGHSSAFMLSFWSA